MSIQRVLSLLVFFSVILFSGCVTSGTVEPVAEVEVTQTSSALVPVTSTAEATAYPPPATATIHPAYPPPIEPTWTPGPEPTEEPTPTVPPLPTLIPTPEVTPIPTAEPPFIPLPPDQELQPFSVLYTENSTIWAVDSNGGDPYSLVNVQDVLSLYIAPTSVTFGQWGAASPNGTMLAVVLSSQETYDHTQDDYPELSLYLYHVQQQTWSKLTDGGLEPTWSPDSSKIAYRGPQGGLWVVDITTGESREVYAVDYEKGHVSTDFSWAPDSQRLVFLDSILQNSENLMVVDIAKPENAIVVLPDDPYWVYFPRWSPVGDQIFFVSSAGTRSSSENINNLWLINSDGSGLTQITQDLEVIAGGIPSWSPYGEWIVVSGFLHYEETEPDIELWLISASDAGLKRLTDTPNVNESVPFWISDGIRLVFQRGNPAGDNILRSLWLVNLFDGSEMELASSSPRNIVILPQP